MTQSASRTKPSFSQQKEYPKISVLNADGIVTSAYGTGQWVCHGEGGSVGKIIGITWQDKFPVLTYQKEHTDWRGDWSEGGFIYQIHQLNEFDSWDNIPEEEINEVICEAPAGDFDDIERSYLESMSLLGEIRDCFQKRRKEVPEVIFELLGFRSVWGRPKYLPGMHVRWKDESKKGAGVIVRVERELDSTPGFWLYSISSIKDGSVESELVAEYRIQEILDALSLEDIKTLSI